MKGWYGPLRDLRYRVLWSIQFALEGRVEIVAAAMMLVRAAVGAQFGTLAIQYVKGLKIRLYFAVTIALAGVSVIFKYIAVNYKAMYSSDLNAWVKSNTALCSAQQWGLAS